MDNRINDKIEDIKKYLEELESMFPISIQDYTDDCDILLALKGCLRQLFACGQKARRPFVLRKTMMNFLILNV